MPHSHQVQPYHVRDPKHWAVDQEIQRHDDALWHLGELAMFCLLWSIDDHNDGYVDRCHTCWYQNDRVSSAYGQGRKNKCPSCYGTTFEGGYRALIIRPTIITDGNEGEEKTARGVMHPETLSFESTTDFRVRKGDYIFRADGARYQLRTPTTSQLRTGFKTPDINSDAVGYHLNVGNLEDDTSVAYIIPPNEDELNTILTQLIRLPQDASRFEDVRGPLRPEPKNLSSYREEVDPYDKSLTGIWSNPHGTPDYP